MMNYTGLKTITLIAIILLGLLPAESTRPQVRRSLQRVNLHRKSVAPDQNTEAATSPEKASGSDPDTGEDLVAVEEGQAAPIDRIVSDIAWFMQSQQSKGEGVLDTLGVKLNGEGDTEAFYSALSFVSMMTVGTILLFLVVRYNCPPVWLRSLEADDPLQSLQQSMAGRSSLDSALNLMRSDNTLFGWISLAWRATDDEIVQTAGLDALMFLEFCWLFAKVMLAISPVVVGVICPMHCFMIHTKTEQSDILTKIGINTLIDGKHIAPSLYWVHCVLVWYIVLATLILTERSHSRFLQLRFKWLSDIPDPRSTTLMVECIPKEHRSDEALRAYFVHLFGEDAIERAYVVRRVDHLSDLIRSYETNIHLLEQAKSKWEKSGYEEGKQPKLQSFSFFSQGEDAIDTYSIKVTELKEEIATEQQRIEQAVTDHDLSVCCNAGFVTFTSKRWCRFASREQYMHDITKLMVSMPPEPSDIIYEDLAHKPSERFAGFVMAGLVMILVLICFTPAVAFTRKYTNMDTVKYHVPFVRQLCEASSYLDGVLQALLGTLALKFLMMWMPTIFMYSISQFLTLKSGAWAQLHLQSRIFAFEVIYVIFIVTIGGSVTETVASFKVVTDHPRQIFSLLAKSLPKASNFYLNYVLFSWFTAVTELMRWFNLFKFLIYSRVGNVKSAKEQSEPEDQDCLGMGARMSRSAMVMTLALVFSTVSPFISVMALVFFALSTVVHTYLFMFVETKKADLGGAFWIQSLYQILFALALFVALMVGILSLKSWGKNAAGATSLALLVIFYAYRRLGQLNWQILPFEAVAEACHAFQRRRSIHGRGGKAEMYVQPQVEFYPKDDLGLEHGGSVRAA